MDKKSKWLMLIFSAVIIAIIALTFIKYFVAKDYYIQTGVDCDPTTEKCFIYECDPETEECSDDPEENISYYKLINKKAYLFPDCDPNDESCPQVSCDFDNDCEETLCDESSAEEGVSCNDPEEYKLNNPEDKDAIEEEAEGEESEEDASNEDSEETADVENDESSLEDGSDLQKDESVEVENNSEKTESLVPVQ